jgi:uncharacterized protein YqhQ
MSENVIIIGISLSLFGIYVIVMLPCILANCFANCFGVKKRKVNISNETDFANISTSYQNPV